MDITIVFGTGGAPLYRITANEGEAWHLKISRSMDIMFAFASIDGSGLRQDVFPSDPGTYWFYLSNSAYYELRRISYTILPPPPVLPPKPSEPIPAPTGYYPAGNIGTMCEIQQFSAFNQVMFRYRNKYTNWSGGTSPSFSQTTDAANRDPQCFAPPPPTAATWQDGVSLQIKSSFNVLGNFLNTSVNTIIKPINDELAGLESRILAKVAAMIAGIHIDTAALEAAILSKLGVSISQVSAGLTGLDTKFTLYLSNALKGVTSSLEALESRILAKMTAEITAINTSLAGIENRILDKVSSNILELLLKKLMEGR